MNIKLSANYSAILVLTLLLIAAALTQYGMRMQQQIFDKERYQRVLYAFGIELLQSSDELTTMARRYVVSKDEIYKQYYLEILAIRNGEKVRPERYNATYWKLEGLDSQRQANVGTAASLQKLMKQNGLTGQEFDLLTQSQQLSDELVNIEKQAFSAIEHRQDALAVDLMFNKHYDDAKALIMQPLQQLLDAIYIRGREDLTVLTQRLIYLDYLMTGLIALIILTILVLIYLTHKKVLQPFLLFFQQTDKISQGDYQARCNTDINNELGQLANHFNSMAEAVERDIKRQEQEKESILEYANYDQLTGLPNRRMLEVLLDQKLKESHRSGEQMALLFLDLDKFKEVNDTLGHHAGDQLLVEVSNRIKGRIRESDVVARISGDEFIVLLDNLKDPSILNRIAQELIDALNAQFTLGAEKAFVTASMGIALYPSDTESSETLISYADQAMYQAKEQGRNGFCYFTPEMQTDMKSRVKIINDLHFAQEKGQFELHYQPIIQLETGEICKAEALIRWNHPEDGLISPAQFIPLAEQAGMIDDIGNWVFYQATQQLKLWNDLYNDALQISINKSPLQFHNEASNQEWVAHIKSLDLPAENFIVEITESILMSDHVNIAQQLSEAREGGMKIALDDFGTGYSSLSYLSKFSLDYLKIDRSFTEQLVAGSSVYTLCETIVIMAHKLGLEVIAEGVETELQKDLLIQAGCDYAQGYLFSKPVSASDFENLIKISGQSQLITAIP